MYKLFAIILLMAISVNAEVPLLIDYQGRLTDPSGDPVPDDKYNFVFSIYESASSTTPLWSSGSVSIVTEDGLFNYTLGSKIAAEAIAGYIIDKNILRKEPEK